MRKIGSLIAFLFVMFLVTSVQAVTFPDPWKAKFYNYEWFNPNLTQVVTSGDGVEDNWGIANVTTIFDVNDNLVWWQGKDGDQLRTLFWGLDVTYWDGTNYKMGVATEDKDGNPLSGAYFEIYLWDSDDPSYKPLEKNVNNRTYVDSEHYSYDSITNGTLLVRFEFTYGVDANQDVIAAGTTVNLANPPNGDGTAYLKVVPNVGTMWELFDKNNISQVLDQFGISHNSAWIDPEADMFIKFSFNAINPITNGGFQIKSDDPAYGAAPEPASIILMGSGLMLMAAVARKRFIKK